MVMTPFPGGLFLPSRPWFNNSTIGSTSAGSLNATGNRMAIVGRVQFHEAGTKDIVAVGFAIGNTATGAGGSVVRISLQDVTTGFNPDGTQDQFVDHPISDITLNRYFKTDPLDSPRTVNNGDPIALVIEFDGAGRLGSDSLNLAQISLAAWQVTQAIKTYNGTTWSTVSSANMGVIFYFDDGSVGSLSGSLVSDTVNVTSFANNSTPDERGIQFTFPFACRVSGAWFIGATNATARDFTVCLYEGTTLLTSHAVDADLHGTGTLNWYIPFPVVDLAANATHRLTLRPDTTGQIGLNYQTQITADEWESQISNDMIDGYVTRTDGGAFNAVDPLLRPLMGLIIAGMEFDAGGGGGGQRGIIQ